MGISLIKLIRSERDIIKSANREILLKIKSEVFVPLNSALFIAGQYDKEKVRTLVDKYFLTWQNPKDWKPQPPINSLILSERKRSSCMTKRSITSSKPCLQGTKRS